MVNKTELVYCLLVVSVEWLMVHLSFNVAIMIISGQRILTIGHFAGMATFLSRSLNLTPIFTYLSLSPQLLNDVMTLSITFSAVMMMLENVKLKLTVTF